MSTVEYICDERFEFLGLGTNTLVYEPEDIEDYLNQIDYNDCTIVMQRAMFDALILKEKFNIQPKYIIDILDLARHYDSRMKHDLDSLAKMFKLKPKGNTNQFKGLHYEQMDEWQKAALVEYTLGDVEIETDLFKILLPLLSNPHIEIPIANHTLNLYLSAKIQFDNKLAISLKQQMKDELVKKLNKIQWALFYEN